MSVLVGKKAPAFSAAAVVNGVEFVEDFSLDRVEYDSSLYTGWKYTCSYLCNVSCYQSNIEQYGEYSG